jgi:5-methylcytosine-specific restriction endonuclease McrA
MSILPYARWKYLDSREAKSVRVQVSRAKKFGEPHSLTYDEWKYTLEYFDRRCAYCGSGYSVIEHVAAIGQGVGTVFGNCVPACKSCNALKAKNMRGFLARAANIENAMKFCTENIHKI